MSQFNYAGAIDPLISGGSDLNTALDAYELAVNSNHSGASRPAYLPANGTWVKTVSGTQHEFTYYDGTDDILIFTVNPVANSVVFVGVSDGVLNTNNLFHVQDQKPSGTDGGSFNQGSWIKRNANTEVTNNITGASLAGNQETLPAGVYIMTGWAMSRSVDRNILRLHNTTSNATLLTGNGGFSDSSTNSTGVSLISGPFTLGVSSVLELQHRCQTTALGTGFGVDVGTDFTVDNELFSDVKFWKVG